MYRLEQAVSALEFDKILSLLAGQTTMDDASAMARSLLPSDDAFEVSVRLQNTEDAFLLLSRYASPSFGRAVNIVPFLRRCEAGGMLNMKELLSLCEVLRVVRSVRDWRNNNNGYAADSLEPYFSALTPNRYLEDKILACIKSEDEMSDTASQSLSAIRRKMSAASANIRSRLDKIVRDGVRNKYLQDAVITQRDGRFVVPVKSEFRNEIGGIVHDSSSTGSTLFIEPMPVVEINNELRVLKAKEKEEIERILMELSSEAASFSDSIIGSYQALVHLNFIFAKASLAYRMKACVPQLNQNGYLRLKNARHPLLNKKTVVPVTVELGGEYTSLVITGPNTGGKTVTLKTVGLLSMMAMSGLMIPVDDGSSVPIFDHILIDIGDEQSIEQSLSTFSSHMVNIISILDAATDRSLVLVDELGGGTDPVEGAALAQSILETFHQRGVRCVATTHYAQLKSYALDTPGVQNASCEFDRETLRPTYRLLVGVPGRSNAFAIAKALGMPQTVIDDASALLTDEDQRFERVVAVLEQTRQQAEQERLQVAELRQQLTADKEKLDHRLDIMRQKEEAVIKKAEERASLLVENARNQSDILLNQLETVKKQLTAEKAGEIVAKARAAAKAGIRSLEKLTDPVNQQSNEDYTLPRPLQVGDKVMVVSLQQSAVVLSISGDSVKVSVGSMQVMVSQKDLRLCEPTSVRSNTRTVKNRPVQNSVNTRFASMELDIRGMNVEEGLMELDRYLDQAVMSGMTGLAVIHGKGTGVLRAAVQSHLRRHPAVRSYRLGTFGEGESGVTIVELK